MKSLTVRALTLSALFVVMFFLVLDRQYCHDIQGRFVAIQGEVAASSKVDDKLTKTGAIFRRSSYQGRLFEWDKCFADGKQSASGGACVFFEQKSVKSGNV